MGSRKLFVVADPHLGSRKYPGVDPKVLETVISSSFYKAMAIASQRDDISRVVVAGDLFHGSVVPPGPVSDCSEAMALLDCGVDVLAGNHDTPNTDEDSSLHYITGLFGSGKRTRKLFSPGEITAEGFGSYLAIPFDRKYSARQAFDNAASMITTDCRVAIAHYGLTSSQWGDGSVLSKSPDFMDASDAIMFCRDHGIKTLICGHRHDFQVMKKGGVTVMCLGALSPTSFNQCGPDYGNFIVVDSDGDYELNVGVKGIPGLRYIRDLNFPNSDLIGCTCLTDNDSLPKKIDLSEDIEVLGIDPKKAKTISLNFVSPLSPNEAIVDAALEASTGYEELFTALTGKALSLFSGVDYSPKAPRGRNARYLDRACWRRDDR